MAEQTGQSTPLRRAIEPVVRPAGMPPHHAHVVRRARLYAEGRTLVVRDGRLRERRYGVGGDGIRHAVFIPPGDLWETVQKRPMERWGVLAFKSEAEREVLRVPLAAWLPEAGVVGAMDLRPSTCLDRTGLRDLVATLGIPLEEGLQPADGVEVRENSRGPRPDRAVHGDLPRWHSWARGLGMFGWFVAAVIAFAADLVWAMPVAACALLLIPASDGLVRITAWWRNTRSDSFGGALTFRPSPAAGATRRFLRTASIRVLPDDVVLTNTVGEERWLGRAGTHGVARLVRLVAPTTGEPLAVAFLDGKGETRALLPWKHWFAGQQGHDRWAELQAALAVAVEDEKFRQTRSADVWWQGHVLSADVRKMSPMEAKEARKEADWHHSVIGRNELLTLSLFSAVLLAGLFSDELPAFLAGLLSALTIAAALVPAGTSALVSRFSGDKVIEKVEDNA
ncbi:hypothetical protein QNO09_29770 [Streptomyces sp. 378]|uniref:hypothetical protein n=1 Tax=Streptomyces sp. 378 TaxID=3049412 RepID=UPI0024C36938|nr:hypothetical protein [Streptomyces sp. 378]MDK1347414.1 hypothetical protein [Streptomyces sp. 378]